MSIPFKQCNDGNYRKGREFPINWICLHFTANNGDTAQNNADYFAREVVKASAHYFVDPNGVVQSVKDSDTAWHCGRERGGSYYNDCRNANSIGIEMCSVIRNGVYVIPEETMKRAAKLTRELMAKYHVPISRVCRHYDVTHKDCPEPWVRDESLWRKFKARLTAPVEPEPKKEETALTYEQFKAFLQRYEKENEGRNASAWASDAWKALTDAGITDGSAPQAPLTREQLAVMLQRLGLIGKGAK